MQYFSLLLWAFFIFSYNFSFSQSNLDSEADFKTKIKNEIEKSIKWGIDIEIGMTSISSINSETILCYQGQLGLNYRMFSNFQIGLFGQTLLYHQNLDLANIDNKIIDLTSVEYNTVGFKIAYDVPIKKLYVKPSLDFGYNLFLAKALDFPEDKNSFLDYRYLSIQPKLNIGYRITDGARIGLYAGYSKQVSALKGEMLEEFNPNSWIAGINTTISIK